MKKKNIILKLLSELATYPNWFYSAVLLTLIISAVSVIRPLLVNYVLDKVSISDFSKLHLFGIFLIILMLSESALQYLNSIISVIIGQKLVLKIRKNLFQHVLQLPIPYFDKTPVGTVVTRIVSDTEAMNEIFANGFTTILGNIITIIIFLITMIYISIPLTIAVVVVLPFLFLSVWMFKNGVQKSFTLVRNAVANLNRFIQERLVGMSIVQQFNAEKKEMEKFIELNKQHRNAHIQSIWYYSVFFPVLELLSSIAIALVIYTSSLLPHISLGTITFFVMMTQMLFRPLRMLADQLNTFQMGLIAAERIYNLMEENILQINHGNIELQQLKEGIEFRHVTFHYSDKNVSVLKDLTLQFPARKITAIVGHTGAGKSTIISLICRLYDIDQGEILIDHVPIQNYSLQSLRSRIAVVLQDPHLFKDTVLNNVRMFNPNISKESVQQAAKEIGIDNLIMQLNGNYDAIIQERGSNLSAGQKQIIAFLRAYVYQPEIFILDEATSMIDSQTEHIIQDALKKILHNRTAIIIAHRLSTIQMADQIVVLHQGKVVETGTHNELLQSGKYYKEIYESQFESTI
ncbi:MAG: ABC transporter ATP-binding protein/permease [Bacteroidia bacterium]|nr:ABC transporter ATP-binding protein/permease [Bacteroidia bacterium]